MLRRTRTVPIGLGVAGLVAASCAGGSDDAVQSSDTQPASIEIVQVAPPDTAAVIDFVDTIPDTDFPADDDVFDDSDTEPADDAVDIEVFGIESDPATVGALNAVLDVYAESVGVEVTYEGSFDFVSELNTRVASGEPPEIALVSQPNVLLDFARDGAIPPLDEQTESEVRSSWPADLVDLSADDGVLYGVPFSVDMKSLVWHVPDAFDAAGETIPPTLEEFRNLVERSAAAGVTPLCVGIESASATGWVFTDWVEDFVLREHGPDVYDQWVAHDIPFDDARIVASMQSVLDLWSDDRVFAAEGTIAETSYLDNAEPLVDGICLMHRQAAFYSTSFPVDIGLADGSAGAVDVFDLPSDDGRQAVVWATTAAAFDDRPEVVALLAHMSSAAFADDMQRALNDASAERDYLSLAAGRDLELLDDLDRRVADLAFAVDTFRVDASDQMPSEVGAGTFWTVGTDIVNGDLTAAAGAALIEESWPS